MIFLAETKISDVSDEDYVRFYDELAEHYPEAELVYSTLSGKIRKKFLVNRISSFEGSFADFGCNEGTYLKEYHGGKKIGVDISKKICEHFGPLHVQLIEVSSL